MHWGEIWFEIFGGPPVDPTSREVSVQEVVAELVAGHPCAWFLSYTPTEAGRAFLEGLWRDLVGHDHGSALWFVSEYPLPVPEKWRQEIPFTYRCPDFAFGNDDHVLVVELKTERRSYSARQMVDYLRLARHKLPTAHLDVALLGPHRPGATPDHDDRQRYAETTWATVPKLLEDAFPGNLLAERLVTFLRTDLAAPVASPATILDSSDDRIEPAGPLPPGSDAGAPIADEYAAAVAHAQRIAPSVAAAQPGDDTERGINVAFESESAARAAQAQIKAALERSGFADRVGVWLWKPSSLGLPTTEAGRATGIELRLQPKIKARTTSAALSSGQPP
jgi:hypothetical protein